MNKEMIVMSATPDKVMMMVMMMLTMMITMMTMMAATEMNMIMSLVDLLSTSCHHRRPNAKPEFQCRTTISTTRTLGTCQQEAQGARTPTIVFRV